MSKTYQNCDCIFSVGISAGGEDIHVSLSLEIVSWKDTLNDIQGLFLDKIQFFTDFFCFVLVQPFLLFNENNAVQFLENYILYLVVLKLSTYENDCDIRIAYIL